MFHNYKKNLTTTKGNPVFVANPKSSTPCGCNRGGIQTNCVLAKDVMLHNSRPIVTFTSDSSHAKFKFSP